MEAIVICVDETALPYWLDDQMQAIEAYTEHKFKCHPETVIGLLTMSHSHSTVAIHPTRDLDLDYLRIRQYTPIGRTNYMNIDRTVAKCLLMLTRPGIPKGAKKRIFMLVGCGVPIPLMRAAKYAAPFLRKEVALDVVHFYPGDKHGFSKKKLETLVKAVNVNDYEEHIKHINCHIASLRDCLTSFMFVAPGSAEGKIAIDKDVTEAANWNLEQAIDLYYMAEEFENSSTLPSDNSDEKSKGSGFWAADRGSISRAETSKDNLASNSDEKSKGSGFWAADRGSISRAETEDNLASNSDEQDNFIGK